MSKKDNFNEAVYSMFGVGKAPVEEEKEEVPAEVEIPEVKKEEVEVAEVVVEERLPLTRIAEGTALEGKLVAQGDMEIEGEFKGDIEADGGISMDNAHILAEAGINIRYNNQLIRKPDSWELRPTFHKHLDTRVLQL